MTDPVTSVLAYVEQNRCGMEITYDSIEDTEPPRFTVYVGGHEAQGRSVLEAIGLVARELNFGEPV